MTMPDEPFGQRLADAMKPFIDLLFKEGHEYVLTIRVSSDTDVITAASVPPSRQVPIMEEALRVAKRGVAREQARN